MFAEELARPTIYPSFFLLLLSVSHLSDHRLFAQEVSVAITKNTVLCWPLLGVAPVQNDGNGNQCLRRTFLAWGEERQHTQRSGSGRSER